MTKKLLFPALLIFSGLLIFIMALYIGNITDKSKKLYPVIIIAGTDTVTIDNSNWDLTKCHASSGYMDTINHIDTLRIGEIEKVQWPYNLQVDTAYVLNDTLLHVKKKY